MLNAGVRTSVSRKISVSILNLMSVKTDVGRLHIKHLVDPSVDYLGVID